MRSEQTIFDDLARLCSSPGYVHAIAYFCLRDNMIPYAGEMKPENMMHLFSKTRLIRTETSTLIGLLLRQEIDYSVPTADVMQQYISRTEALLEELHHSMSAPFWDSLHANKASEKGFNPFTIGAVLREPIFYGGESAYSFQYRDLSPRKYENDDGWLRANKGFSIQAARDVGQAVGRVLDRKSMATLQALKSRSPEEQTLLPGNTFTSQEIAEATGVDLAEVRSVLTAFAVLEGETNKQFNALGDFNVANASPLLRVADDTYIIFHIYSLVEALYESPFYWMCADNAYVSTAMRNRGLFAERFAAERLSLVFGVDKVHPNVDIFGPRGKKVGEIDTLVLFGNRAIVVQAKSKRLTLESRRGNDGQLRDDFKKSIQDSCDQAYKCAALLGDSAHTLKDAQSMEVRFPMALKEVYVLCLISDHYPALSFQARQFLKFEASKGISPPFVLDVFALDAMTEMLDSPLRLLSYVDRRTKYFDKLVASHELTILSYHLKNNLWLNDEHDMVIFEDEVSADLDVAMLARREGIPGNKTPDGILTRFAPTTLGGLVKQIEAQPNPATIDLGYMLLTLSEETVIEVSKGIAELAKRAAVDRKSHDLTIAVGGTDLTVHCNNDPLAIAVPALERHCYARKYTQRAQSWFGVCVDPNDVVLRFGINLDYTWQRSDELDALTKNMAKQGPLADLHETSGTKKRKIGRNEPCLCGSGRKYKKCCLPRKTT